MNMEVAITVFLFGATDFEALIKYTYGIATALKRRKCSDEK